MEFHFYGGQQTKSNQKFWCILTRSFRLLKDLTRARSRWKGRKRGQQVRPESVPFGERKTIAVRPRSTTETTKRKIYEMDIF